MEKKKKKFILSSKLWNCIYKNKIFNVRQGFDNEGMKAYRNGIELPTNDWSASQPSFSWQIFVPDEGTKIASWTWDLLRSSLSTDGQYSIAIWLRT